jgi:hypothetical protein
MPKFSYELDCELDEEDEPDDDALDIEPVSNVQFSSKLSPFSSLNSHLRRAFK